ncbi:MULTISPECIES: hypothetical protein [Stenotrophomonas]|uniref:Uncharacterized protein n=1 Tax=Stenotrophomonas maltophilia TaxID=40324 RepID=A0A2J0SGQ8_STEMA|nr:MULTISPECIES: hypothetical protein [Stenotrophomonas]MBA0312479.1 hypothetical protein [Stenotrophomonas maltophilia]MBH1409533.1 hypothetical protein [Stenotrophomonas maltophilia]MBH1745452.1 hypothetical protein [Stenotrophomonas maltophilia]MBH1865090.1 hypothetical protein [Stenotrophomonas maltophilia]MDH1389506.1 hypothetical protein [Stenotrophomonas sp. GD03701]
MLRCLLLPGIVVVLPLIPEAIALSLIAGVNPRSPLPSSPASWETLRILLPVSATLAVVGPLESMMTTCGT